MRAHTVSASALAMILAGCAGPLQQQASSDRMAAAVPGVWEYPASDFPTMCMVFLPGGALRFEGGFAFFNPGRWRRHAEDGTIHLTLSGANNFPYEASRFQMQHRPGALVQALPEQRTLVYRIDNDTPSIEFAGFTFYKKPTCRAG